MNDLPADAGAGMLDEQQQVSISKQQVLGGREEKKNKSFNNEAVLLTVETLL